MAWQIAGQGMRADQLLVQQGLAQTRSQAQRLIAAGVCWRLPGAPAWQTVRKTGEDVPEIAEWQLRDTAETRYVSRGGLKLEGALQALGLNVAGWRCLDVGQSTGGFTDCLLQQGAAHVTGVDVGQGQIHPRLRQDGRVTVLEKINARELNRASIDLESLGFMLVVGDLSFISLTLVLPAIARTVDAGTLVLMLVKPQFELQPGQIGKGGIVRDAALYAQVEQRVCAACAEQGLNVLQWLPSPITGGDGNREFFVFARKL